jgi:hypothetical protein
VSPQKYRRIERFKFFLDLASKPRAGRVGLLQRIARLRCQRDEYRFPVEMRVLRWLRPEQRLS